MLKVYLNLVLSLAAAVFAESVRKTETSIPLKNKSPDDDLESSGDFPNKDFDSINLHPTDDEDYSNGSRSGFVEGPIDREVREMETSIPLKNKSPHDDLESSGDVPNEDFEITTVNPIDDEDGDDDNDEVYDYSNGSRSGFVEGPIDRETPVNSNQIPELKDSFKPKPTVNNKVLTESNEVVLPEAPNQDHDQIFCLKAA